MSAGSSSIRQEYGRDEEKNTFGGDGGSVHETFKKDEDICCCVGLLLCVIPEQPRATAMPPPT